MDNGETIILCLVNNDPCSTIFMTPSGQPLYSVTTPSAHPPPSTLQHPPGSLNEPNAFATPESAAAATPQALSPPLKRSNSSPSSRLDNSLRGPLVSSPPNESDPPAITKDCHLRRGCQTIVRRVDDFNITTGHVETTVGTIKGGEDEAVTLELPGEKDFALVIPHAPRHTASLLGATDSTDSLVIADGAPDSGDSDEDGETEDVEEAEGDGGEEEEEEPGIETWDFQGPDQQHYRWFMLGSSPMMAHIDHSMSYPIARYRRAKLGIVSRPRRGLLEIFPHGSVTIDLVVTTFVGFMKTCVMPTQQTLPELQQNPPRIGSRSRGASAPLPIRQHTDASSNQFKGQTTLASPAMSSSIPSRFRSAAALARKHSRSPPATAIPYHPFVTKPRPLPTAALTEDI